MQEVVTSLGNRRAVINVFFFRHQKIVAQEVGILHKFVLMVFQQQKHSAEMIR